MKMKKLILFFTGLIVMVSCSTEKEIKILRLAHTLDTKHPVHKAMVILGEKLEKKSNGTLQVKLYPSGQLGAERECLELLQIGSLDITKVSAAVLENFITEYKVFSIPYLFRDRQHAFDVFDGAIGDEMLTKGDKFRLRGLTFYDAGSRSFYTKEKPISTPTDLEGLKIRVQKSNMAIAMVNSLGGSPTPISWGELYTALQQGVVDGAENNLPSFYTSKHYEICKYFSLDQHTSVPDVLLIGLDTWERLSEQEQKWLKEAARESTIEQRKLWAASEKESLDVITKAGVEIITPDKVPFQENTKSIQDMFSDRPEMVSLIQNIKKINQ
ncbi:DctP family TRAP transporter solute-binding subunit [Aquimarina litoralis]|nr:TRAP transporter substrate-binding protein [Aquimarina litoralis]MBW1296203.1 DctP family TRAP transporter solute-binding subunit [Aquimarina litoralis]